MTARQETRFRCDRCSNEDIMPLDTGGPAHGRMSGPSEWLMLRLGDDLSGAPQHLCPVCRANFEAFMRERNR